MEYTLISVEELYDGKVARVTLGPKPANILSAKMMAEISDALNAVERDPHKQLVIFRGEGKHFSFGASVEEHQPGEVDKMLPGFHRFIRDLLACPVPTLAQVSGQCLGGGFEMVLACTFIIADETARMGVPEIQLGVFPPVAALLLPLKAGDTFGAEVVLTGHSFDAQTLFARDLVTQLVQAGGLDGAVSAFYERHLAKRSASSLRIARQAAGMFALEQYDRLIPRQEALYLETLMATDDAKEGIASFVEKRKPTWVNK